MEGEGGVVEVGVAGGEGEGFPFGEVEVGGVVGGEAVLAGEGEDGLPEPEGFPAFDVDLKLPQLVDELY